MTGDATTVFGPEHIRFRPRHDEEVEIQKNGSVRLFTRTIGASSLLFTIHNSVGYFSTVGAQSVDTSTRKNVLQLQQMILYRNFFNPSLTKGGNRPRFIPQLSSLTLIFPGGIFLSMLRDQETSNLRMMTYNDIQREEATTQHQLTQLIFNMTTRRIDVFSSNVRGEGGKDGAFSNSVM